MEYSEMFQREVPIIGEEGLKRLKNSSVIVFGAGGVGSFAIEALARSGIGRIAVVDSDAVSVSNINRQLFALVPDIGKMKCSLAAMRIKDINPSCITEEYPLFYDENTFGAIDLSGYDFIIDAIDSVPSKMLLIKEAKRLGTDIVSSMGTGNKTDPTRFRVEDIYKTNTCPLASKIRTECRRAGIDSLTVVFSDEKPKRPAVDENGRYVPSSLSFVPPAAGMILAGEAIRKLSGLAE